MYVPEALPEGQAALEDRKKKNYRTGINFGAYEHIPVEVSEFFCHQSVGSHKKKLYNFRFTGEKFGLIE